ncbi:PAS domain S-box-containing protein [Skermanella aerolata]|uniref:hybrid sensor histidine kinase/response regulator n=1 Tax=Skermanella aerolata TaxID=393310 RepID=UPI003D23CE4A
MRIRLVYLLLAAALPIVIFAAVMVVLFDRQQTRSWEAVVRQTAETALNTVDERITTVRIALETLVVTGLPIVEWREEFTGQADRILEQRPEWLALQLTWRGDRIVRTRRGFQIPRSIDEQTDEVFRFGDFRVSGILADRNSGQEPVVAVSVPVQGPYGVEHVLTAYVSAWAINQALRDQGMTPGWRIAVLDTAERLIARTLSEDRYDPGIGGEPDRTLLDGLRSGQLHFFATNLKNENLFVSSAVSTMTGWTVTLGMPGELVEAPARRTLAAVTGGGTLAVALALSIGWLLARTLMKRQVAERRLLQLELAQAAQERTAAILESTTDGVFEVDRDWRIVFINQRARSVIARGADVSGRILLDLLPEVVTTSFWSQYHRVATERVPAEFEEFYPALNAWFYVRAFPSGDGGLAVYFQDVTERRQARDALAESESRYRFLAESVPEIVWTAKPDGTLDYANARLAAYVAASPAEDIEAGGIAQGWNVNWKEVVHPADARSTLDAWRKALADSTPYECEFRLRRADGMYRWHLARGLPMLDETGQVVKWFGTTVDIHDKILYQETLQAARDDAERAKREAEQADLAKSRFLAAASHDLRQPMQSLFLFADGLEQHITDKDGSEKLLHLRRGLDALKQLLDALLDISKLDAKSVTPTVEDFALSGMFGQIEAAYGRVASAKGLAFSIHHQDLAVRTDRTLLGRIVGNLIENAIQYTATGAVRVECRQAGDRVRIDVQDTGIGIPPEQMDDIWREFHQVGNPERDRNKGMGLGLAIVQRLARLLGCRVEVLSALGRGSIFSIEVPAGTAVAVPEPMPEVEPVISPADGRYAVLVDDDAIVLMGLQSILRDWGYDVLAAGSTDQALERLRTGHRKPDIIVADYRLRGGRVGTEAIIRIRELFESNIPGVILTGETGPECAVDAAAHGFSIAHKPITSRQLSMAVEKLLAEASD